MTWRTKRMMRRSRPRVTESRVLGGAVSMLWSGLAIATVVMVAIGLFLYLPGSNAIEAPLIQLP